MKLVMKIDREKKKKKNLLPSPKSNNQIYTVYTRTNV